MSGMFENLRDGVISGAIQQYGMPAVLTITGNSSYDPSSGGVIKEADKTYDVYAIMTEYESKDIDGTLIKIGDKKALITASNSTPEPTSDYTVVLGDKIWAVVRCNPIAPAGIAIVYEVQLRL